MSGTFTNYLHGVGFCQKCCYSFQVCLLIWAFHALVPEILAKIQDERNSANSNSNGISSTGSEKN